MPIGAAQKGGILGGVRAIPDSVVHHWSFSEGNGTTVGDSIGSADMTLTGVSWVSGTWVDGQAGSADGTNEYGTVGSLGPFGSSMDTNFALVVTIQTTQSSIGHLFTANNSGDETYMQHRLNSDGTLRMDYRDADSESDNIGVDSTTAVDDGNKHRVVFNKTANSASGLEIWIDNSEDSTTTVNDGGFDAPTDFDGDVDLWRWPGDADYLDAIVDDVILCDSSLSASEIQDDYNRQPWS